MNRACVQSVNAPARRTIDSAISATLESLEEALRDEGKAIAARAVAEEAFAALAVDQLLKLPPERLRRRSAWVRYRAASVARALLDAFERDCREWTPAWSLAVADAALAIARASDRGTPALIVRACKQRANALGALGRFDEAFRQLDEAEDPAAHTHSRRLHTAILANARAALRRDRQRQLRDIPEPCG